MAVAAIGQNRKQDRNQNRRQNPKQERRKPGRWMARR